MQLKSILRSPFEPGILTYEAFLLSFGIIIGSSLLGYLIFFYISTQFRKSHSASSSSSSSSTEDDRENEHCKRMSRLFLEMQAVIQDGHHASSFYCHGFGPKERIIWALHHISDLRPDGSFPKWLNMHDENYIKIITHYDGLIIPDGRLVLQDDLLEEAEGEGKGGKEIVRSLFCRGYKRGELGEKGEEGKEAREGKEGMELKDGADSFVQVPVGSIK